MRPALLALALALLLPGVARAEKGAVTGTFSLGTSFFSDDLTHGKVAALPAVAPLSEFAGAGWFVTDHWRLALNLQVTELLTAPPEGQSRLTTIALLPQASYAFGGHFFAAAVAFVPLRFGGVNRPGFGLQGVLGVSLPLTSRLAATAALEVPFIVAPVMSFGLSPLVGVAARL